MKPKAQRIAIAEWCGWNTDKKQLGGVFVYHDKGGIMHGALPDYLNDLNAIQEAEMKLRVGFDVSEADEYQSTLYGIVNPGRSFIKDFCNGGDVRFTQNFITATAAQRAEALLRTIGKWQDDTTKAKQ